MSDAEIIVSPTARAARARIAPLVTMVTPQIASVRNSAPSYVASAIDDLFAAIERWTVQEKELVHGSR